MTNWSYEWTQASNFHAGSIATPPLYDTLGQLAVSTQSSLGPGSELVRCEFGMFATIAAVVGGTLVSPYWFMMQSGRWLGEVYDSGSGGFPQPGAVGVVRAVISGRLNLTYESFGVSPFTNGSARLETMGMETSQGQRHAPGGAGITPELRIGVALSDQSGGIAALLDRRWAQGYFLRALWRIAV